MDLTQAEKVGQLLTRPIKLTTLKGNKIVGRFVEVRELNRPDDPMGDSRVVVLRLEGDPRQAVNFSLESDQVADDGSVQVYMSGQLDWLIAQVAGKVKPSESPFVLITYEGVQAGVETEKYGKKDVHRFTVKVVPETK